MASTLDAGGASPPVLRKGHGTAALGPSDSSDSGSDVLGGPGNEGDGLLLRTGTTSDPDLSAKGNAGADLGDADLDSDTDREGTGERAAVGRDATTPVDTALHDVDDGKTDNEDPPDDEALDASIDTTRRDENSRARPVRGGT